MKKRLVHFQGWIISAIFIGLLLYHLEWSRFVEALAKLSPLHIVFLVAIYLTGFIFRGLRCRLLLPMLSTRQATGAVFIGYAANNLLPARLGELARAHIVGKGSGISRALTLSTIVVERILDGFIIVILLIIGSGSLLLPPWAEQARFFGLVLFSSALLCVLLAGRFEAHLKRFIPEGRIGELLGSLLEGLAIVARSKWVIAALLGYSIVIWTIEAMMFWYGFPIFGINEDLFAAFFTLGIVNLGILIPNSPGNVGVFQYFTVLALGVFAVDATIAAAYSVVIHICQFVPVTVIGVLSLRYFGVSSLSSLVQKPST